MSEQLLLVAHGADDSAHAEGIATRILACWPESGRAPTLKLVEHAELLLQARTSRSPTLVVGDAALCGARLQQLLDALDGRCVPAVMLLDQQAKRVIGGEGEGARSGADGVIVCGMDVPPSVLAPMLFAMAVRQRTIERLSHELVIAQHCQGGMHGEISRMHEEMSLAARIQRDFMPRGEVNVQGFDVAVLHQPTGYVSGDMYSVRRIDERTVGVLIADAVGHGVPAALLTMIIARSVQSAPDHVLADPSAMLLRLNKDLMAAQSGSTRFVTAVYATVDEPTRRVRIAGAGHPPPFWISQGRVERIETNGPLLGVFEDATFDAIEIDLRPGQTLLMYTDGFEMCFPKAGAVGDELRRPTMTYVDHFERLCNPSNAGTLQEAMGELQTTLLEQAGSLHQADDVTALAIAARLHPGERLAA